MPIAPPPPPISPRWISIDRAARLCDVSPKTVRRNVLPYVTTTRIGKRRLINLEDFESWLRRNSGKSAGHGQQEPPDSEFEYEEEEELEPLRGTKNYHHHHHHHQHRQQRPGIGCRITRHCKGGQ